MVWGYLVVIITYYVIPVRYKNKEGEREMKRKNGERIKLKKKQTWAWKISLTKKEENDDDETCNKATMAKKQAAIVKQLQNDILRLASCKTTSNLEVIVKFW